MGHSQVHGVQASAVAPLTHAWRTWPALRSLPAAVRACRRGGRRSLAARNAKLALVAQLRFTRRSPIVSLLAPRVRSADRGGSNSGVRFACSTASFPFGYSLTTRNFRNSCRELVALRIFDAIGFLESSGPCKDWVDNYRGGYWQQYPVSLPHDGMPILDTCGGQVAAQRRSQSNAMPCSVVVDDLPALRRSRLLLLANLPFATPSGGAHAPAPPRAWPVAAAV